FERNQRVPGDLATALARLSALAQGHWAAARESDDYPGFAPVLAEVVALKREEGAALAADGDVYDALLDDYEPDAKAAELEAMFAALRPGLIALRDAALGASAAPQVSGRFDAEAQMRLARQLAKVCGYDMT